MSSRGDNLRDEFDGVRQHLKNLESVLGIKIRSRGKLTKDGIALAVVAETYLRALLNFASDRARRLRIGGGDRLLYWLVLPRISDLRKALEREQRHDFAGAIIELVSYPTSDVHQDLQTLALDAAIVRGGIPAKDRHFERELRRVKIGTTRYKLFVPNIMIRDARTFSAIDGLQQFPFADGGGLPFSHGSVLPNEEANGIAGVIERMGKDAKQKISVKKDVICATFVHACALVRLGTHTAVLPEQAKADLPDASAFDIPFLESWGTNIELMWNSNQERQCNRTRSLVDALKSVLSTEKLSVV